MFFFVAVVAVVDPGVYATMVEWSVSGSGGSSGSRRCSSRWSRAPVLNPSSARRWMDDDRAGFHPAGSTCKWPVGWCLVAGIILFAGSAAPVSAKGRNIPLFFFLFLFFLSFQRVLLVINSSSIWNHFSNADNFFFFAN